MTTGNLPLKVRLAPPTYQKLHELHPNYGEASRVARVLIESYVVLREQGICASSGFIDEVAQGVVDGEASK